MSQTVIDYLTILGVIIISPFALYILVAVAASAWYDTYFRILKNKNNEKEKK